MHGLATKKGAALQRDLFGSKDSVASLRAVHVTVNEAARQDEFGDLRKYASSRNIHYSIAFFKDIPSGEAVENLSSWETSKGFTLPDRLVEIKAKRSWESVDALIIPKKRQRSIR